MRLRLRVKAPLLLYLFIFICSEDGLMFPCRCRCGTHNAGTLFSAKGLQILGGLQYGNGREKKWKLWFFEHGMKTDLLIACDRYCCLDCGLFKLKYCFS